MEDKYQIEDKQIHYLIEEIKKEGFHSSSSLSIKEITGQYQKFLEFEYAYSGIPIYQSESLQDFQMVLSMIKNERTT